LAGFREADPAESIMRKLLLVFVLLSSAAVSVRGQAPAEEWRQFRGTPALTGASAGSVPAAPKLLWSYNVGGPIASSAAIAGGVVYAGGGDGDLVALDLASGKLRWKYATGNLIGESSPAVSGDAVYIGDLGGVLHAVSVRDGKLLWTFKTGGEIKASPVVADGVVLIGSYDTHLYAIDARTGKPRWDVVTKGMVHATAGVRDGMTFVTGCDALFRAIRIADGKEVFQIETGAYTAASPLLAGDRAYVGTFNAEVLALDLTRRAVVWRYSQEDTEFPYYSSAALDGNRLILGGRDKLVHAIDTTSGKRLWTFATRARVDSSPVVAGGRVYVGSGDGRLYVLDSASGKKLWEFDTGAGIAASPAIAAGRVVIGAEDGRLYVFG
jgi:outer membrane protein assembly factor BamB